MSASYVSICLSKYFTWIILFYIKQRKTTRAVSDVDYLYFPSWGLSSITLGDDQWRSACYSGVKGSLIPHLVKLADVVRPCTSLGPVQSFYHGSHVMQLHWKLALTLRTLTHPLLHDLHQVKLWVQQPHDCCMCLRASQILSKTHLWIIKPASQPRTCWQQSVLKSLCVLISGAGTEQWAEAAANDQQQLLLCGHRKVSFPYEHKKYTAPYEAALPHVCLYVVRVFSTYLLSI